MDLGIKIPTRTINIEEMQKILYYEKYETKFVLLSLAVCFTFLLTFCVYETYKRHLLLNLFWLILLFFTLIFAHRLFIKILVLYTYITTDMFIFRTFFFMNNNSLKSRPHEFVHFSYFFIIFLNPTYMKILAAPVICVLEILTILSNI